MNILDFLSHLDENKTIRLTRIWGADHGRRGYFELVLGRESQAIHALVDALEAGHEICFIFSERMEQYRYVRCLAQGSGYEMRRAGHGSVGPWRIANRAEAVAWLMEVAEQNRNVNPLVGAPYYHWPAP